MVHIAPQGPSSTPSGSELRPGSQDSPTGREGATSVTVEQASSPGASLTPFFVRFGGRLWASAKLVDVFQEVLARNHFSLNAGFSLNFSQSDIFKRFRHIVGVFGKKSVCLGKSDKRGTKNHAKSAFLSFVEVLPQNDGHTHQNRNSEM